MKASLVPSALWDVTFPSTANAILKTGAEPVLADIDRTTWTIDVTRLDELVTDRTKAIIVVHLYGQPCDMDAICAFSRQHNLFVIEDCAEAHGARFNDKHVGSFGIINCFSFFGNKVKKRKKYQHKKNKKDK